MYLLNFKNIVPFFRGTALKTNLQMTDNATEQCYKIQHKKIKILGQKIHTMKKTP